MLSFEDMAAVKQREFNANEELFMDLNDMAGAFYCLGIGLIAASLAFLLEIFYCDFLQRLGCKCLEWR